MRLTSSELATILHGLRMIQCEGRLEGCAAGDCEHFDDAPALTNESIDELCMRLNFESAKLRDAAEELFLKLDRTYSAADSIRIIRDALAQAYEVTK